MGYIEEAPSWRLRRRHRQQITLAVVLLLLVAAGGVGYAVYSGAIGGPPAVDLSKLPTCAPTPAPLRPEQVVVNVYNSTQRTGLAAKTATTLSLRHFAIGTYANDPRPEAVKGTAIIRYGPKGAAAARLVAAHVAGAQLVNDKRKNAIVDLVLGAKYAGLKPLSALTATPTPTPTCRTAQPVATVRTTRPAHPATTGKAVTGTAK